MTKRTNPNNMLDAERMNPEENIEEEKGKEFTAISKLHILA